MKTKAKPKKEKHQEDSVKKTQTKRVKKVLKEEVQNKNQVLQEKGTDSFDMSLFKKQFLDYIKANMEEISTKIKKYVYDTDLDNYYFSYADYLRVMVADDRDTNITYNAKELSERIDFNYDTKKVIYRSNYNLNIDITAVKIFAQKYGFKEEDIINKFYNDRYYLIYCLKENSPEDIININERNNFYCEKEIDISFTTDTDALISFIEKDDEFLLYVKKYLEKKYTSSKNSNENSIIYNFSNFSIANELSMYLKDIDPIIPDDDAYAGNSLLFLFNKNHEQIKKDLLSFIIPLFDFENELKKKCNTDFWLNFLERFFK